MSAKLYKQEGGGNNAASTSTTFTPTEVIAGNTLVIVWRSASATGSAFAVPTDAGGNTWIVPDPPKGGVAATNNTYLAFAYVHNCVVPGLITMTHASASSRLLKVFQVWNLLNAAPDVATEDFTHSTGTTDIRSAAGTPSQGGVFLIGAANYPAAGNIYPTGVTAGWTLAAQPPNTGGMLATAFKVGTAPSVSEQAAFSGLSSAVYGAGLIGFKQKPDRGYYLLGAQS